MSIIVIKPKFWSTTYTLYFSNTDYLLNFAKSDVLDIFNIGLRFLTLYVLMFALTIVDASLNVYGQIVISYLTNTRLYNVNVM